MPETNDEMRYPVSLKGDERNLRIAWSDGAEHVIPWEVLRRLCPCATCRTERDKPPEPPPLLPVIKPEEARPIRAAGMNPVGNYAYNIQFNDGHNTGIYTLEFLRELGEQIAKQVSSP